MTNAHPPKKVLSVDGTESELRETLSLIAALADVDPDGDEALRALAEIRSLCAKYVQPPRVGDGTVAQETPPATHGELQESSVHENTASRFQVRLTNELGIEAWHRHVHGGDKDHKLVLVQDDEGIFVICAPCGESVFAARYGTKSHSLHEDAPAVPIGLNAKSGVDYGCGLPSCTKCYEEAQLPRPGEELVHDLPDGGRIQMMQEAVYILDARGQELACWVDEEWTDKEAVTFMLNAVNLALKHGADAVRRRIQSGGLV